MSDCFYHYNFFRTGIKDVYADRLLLVYPYSNLNIIMVLKMRSPFSRHEKKKHLHYFIHE